MEVNNQTAAICGLFCGTCPFYPQDCHGCLSDKLTEHCVSCTSGFRDCARRHNVIRCYECHEFPCNRLEHFSKQHWEHGICHHATVIEDLQYMQEHGVADWLSKKINENTCPKCKKLIDWYDKELHQCENNR